MTDITRDQVRVGDRVRLHLNDGLVVEGPFNPGPEESGRRIGMAAFMDEADRIELVSRRPTAPGLYVPRAAWGRDNCPVFRLSSSGSWLVIHKGSWNWEEFVPDDLVRLTPEGSDS